MNKESLIGVSFGMSDDQLVNEYVIIINQQEHEVLYGLEPSAALPTPCVDCTEAIDKLIDLENALKSGKILDHGTLRNLLIEEMLRMREEADELRATYLSTADLNDGCTGSLDD